MIALFASKGMHDLETHIRRLSVNDYEALQQLQSGIADDYVLRIFRESVRREATYGVFSAGRLLAMAAYSLYAGRYAVLGRVRTDARYRGHGLATKLLSLICGEIERQETADWIGLSTEWSNGAMRHVAEKLKLDCLSVYESCVLAFERLSEWRTQLPFPEDSWEPVEDVSEKRERLISAVQTMDRPLTVFPYACYYPLPFEADLFSADYVANGRMYESGGQFFLLMNDTKGKDYLHLKIFDTSVIDDPGLWHTAAREAEKAGRDLWVDLPPDAVASRDWLRSFHCTRWTCYGRKTLPSVDRSHRVYYNGK
ncbi:MAG TPA: GNAT family N-acetyltransferase [Bacillales bacterium]|nr:GNAT family N-acetyltransferase [Bacillales bacterium]